MPRFKPHTKETKRKISIAHRGMHHSQKTKDKLRQLNLGKKYSDITKQKHSEDSKRLGLKPPPGSFKGRKHTEESRIKMSKSAKGRKVWNKGIGTLTPITKLIRVCERYKQWRQSVFFRDDFTCQHCGIRGSFLEAHHWDKSFSVLIKEAQQNIPLLPLYEAVMIYTPFWDLNNGIALCKKCHNKTKKGGRKC